MSSIEIPNNMVAAGIIYPLEVVPELTDPVLSARGLQEYNPASAYPDMSGGYTRAAAGTYFLKLLQGLDPLEGVAFVNTAPVFANTGLVPYDVGAPGTLDDGMTVGVLIGSSVEALEDAPFTFGVWRFATGPHGSEEIFG